MMLEGVELELEDGVVLDAGERVGAQGVQDFAFEGEVGRVPKARDEVMVEDPGF